MVYGVVLAGGVGSRMGGDKPKQYLTVKDKPIIIYTIEKFISVPQLEKILVLCPSKWVEHTKNLIAKHIAPAAAWRILKRRCKCTNSTRRSLITWAT